MATSERRDLRSTEHADAVLIDQGPGQEPEASDGRRERRVVNRRAVVDAMIALYADGHYTPTAAEIAERSGLSVRSLYRYFDDVDDLAGAAIAHQALLAYPLLAVEAEPTDALDVRIARLVESRIRQYEFLAPAARAARAVAHRRPAVAEKLAEVNGIRREQIRSLFEAELEAMPPARARRSLATADVLCSFECHQLFRLEEHFGPDELAAHLGDLLATLFTSDQS